MFQHQENPFHSPPSGLNLHFEKKVNAAALLGLVVGLVMASGAGMYFFREANGQGGFAMAGAGALCLLLFCISALIVHNLITAAKKSASVRLKAWANAAVPAVFMSIVSVSLSMLGLGHPMAKEADLRQSRAELMNEVGQTAEHGKGLFVMGGELSALAQTTEETRANEIKTGFLSGKTGEGEVTSVLATVARTLSASASQISDGEAAFNVRMKAVQRKTARLDAIDKDTSLSFLDRQEAYYETLAGLKDDLETVRKLIPVDSLAAASDALNQNWRALNFPPRAESAVKAMYAGANYRVSSFADDLSYTLESELPIVDDGKDSITLLYEQPRAFALIGAILLLIEGMIFFYSRSLVLEAFSYDLAADPHSIAEASRPAPLTGIDSPAVLSRTRT